MAQVKTRWRVKPGLQTVKMSPGADSADGCGRTRARRSHWLCQAARILRKSCWTLLDRAVRSLVQPLPGRVEPAPGLAGLEPSRQLIQMAAFRQNAPPHNVDPSCAGTWAFPFRSGNGHFRSGFRPAALEVAALLPVCHKEVADGEINFVADGGDDGQPGMKNGAGHNFLIEGPEVFQAASAAREKDEVKRAGEFLPPGIEQADGRGDFRRRARALDSTWDENDFDGRIAALHDMQHIANGRAGGGGDQADALRKAGQGTLSFRREKTLGVQLFCLSFSKAALSAPISCNSTACTCN